MSHLLCYTIRMILKPLPDRIKIEAIKPLASKHTKERISEKGPWFDVQHGRQTVAPTHHGDQWHWLLRSGDWLGWLPINEFRVIEKSA